MWRSPFYPSPPLPVSLRPLWARISLPVCFWFCSMWPRPLFFHFSWNHPESSETMPLLPPPDRWANWGQKGQNWATQGQKPRLTRARCYGSFSGLQTHFLVPYFSQQTSLGKPHKWSHWSVSMKRMLRVTSIASTIDAEISERLWYFPGSVCIFPRWF